jgi:methylated-DNA-protein-cysteine methyltransferase-like protein
MKRSSRRRLGHSESAKPPKFARAVYALVRDVPRGRVVTYGQVAAILGHARAARAVGTALHNLPRPLARIVPWQRVINASGRISIRGDLQRPDLQRQLLEMEGVAFRGSQIDLRTYRWSGPRRERRVRLSVEVPFERQRPAAQRRRSAGKSRKSGR